VATDLQRLLGRNLRELRTRRGLTQEGLAERCGLRPSQVSRVETATQAPSLGTLEALAKGLTCSVASLFRSAPRDLDADQLMDAYARLDEGHRDAVLRLAMNLASQRPD